MVQAPPLAGIRIVIGNTAFRRLTAFVTRSPSAACKLVALDARAVSHLQLLQNALRAEAPRRYCIFDVMFAGREDLRGLPLIERKTRLRRILPRQPLLAFSAHRPASGVAFFEEAQASGLEGIMAKRASSPYRSGARTADWLKIKTARRQEVVIAGFTA